MRVPSAVRTSAVACGSGTFQRYVTTPTSGIARGVRLSWWPGDTYISTERPNRPQSIRRHESSCSAARGSSGNARRPQSLAMRARGCQERGATTALGASNRAGAARCSRCPRPRVPDSPGSALCPVAFLVRWHVSCYQTPPVAGSSFGCRSAGRRGIDHCRLSVVLAVPFGRRRPRAPCRDGVLDAWFVGVWRRL